LDNSSNHSLFGGASMKRLFNSIWDAIKTAKEVRAKAVIAGAHWY
jgi:hypothetical protein